MSVQADDIKSSLIFNGYSVEKIDFEINKEYNKENKKVEIDFDIRRKVNVNYDSSKANVTLNIFVFKDAIKNKYPFSLNVVVKGYFGFENCDKEKMQSLANLNAIAILFPYVRSIITSITSTANINPLILPPVNVVKLIEQNS